jgi:hypothetical protein
MERRKLMSKGKASGKGKEQGKGSGKKDAVQKHRGPFKSGSNKQNG